MVSGVVLINTSIASGGSSVTTAVHFGGGQGVLVIGATQLAPVVTVMMPGVGVANRELKVNSGVINAEGIFGPYYFPAGNYRVHNATGSSIGLFIGMFPTP